MRQRHFSGQSTDVCSWACYLFHTALRQAGWSTSWGSFSLMTMVQLLLRAAVEGRSLHAMASRSSYLPGAETIRLLLHRWLPATTAQLQPVITATLGQKLPKALSRRKRTMAIDVHTRPYYGDKDTPGTWRSQPKASTKTFFAYATLMVIRKGMTFTVGIVPVVKGNDWPAIIDQLLAQALALGLKPRRLLLDRGFYSAQVMLHLQQKKLPYMMPMIQRGKKGKTKATSTATRQFFLKRRRGWDRYTWEARLRKSGQQAGSRTTVTTDVCITPRPGQTPLVFACHGLNRIDPTELAKLYRRRFRIETSYRQMKQGLAMTCSKNPVYRLLLILLGCLLRNLWLWLNRLPLGRNTDTPIRHRDFLMLLSRLLDRHLNLRMNLFALTHCPVT